MSASPEGLLQCRQDGKDQVLSYARIPSTGWFLCVTTDKSEIFAPVTKQLIALTTLGLIFLASGVSIVVVFISRLLRPLGSFCERVSDIAQGGGDLTKRIDVGDRNDEIGGLADKLNFFVQYIRDIIVQISGVSNELSAPDGDGFHGGGSSRVRQGYRRGSPD